MPDDEAWGVDPDRVTVTTQEMVDQALSASIVLRSAGCECSPAALLGLYLIVLQNWPLVGLQNGELKEVLLSLLEDEIKDRMERGE